MHYCYILHHCYSKATYNGYTNNLTKRLRQHNGEISGGARSTSRFEGGWSYLCIIANRNPNWDSRRALSLEWHIRYPTNKRPRPKEYQGPIGRLLSISGVLNHQKFEDFRNDWIIYVNPEYKNVGEDINAKMFDNFTLFQNFIELDRLHPDLPIPTQ